MSVSEPAWRCTVCGHRNPRDGYRCWTTGCRGTKPVERQPDLSFLLAKSIEEAKRDH